MTVITDVCLCEYTDHGHCGLLDIHHNVENDTTLPLLAEMAFRHAEAGADFVAPSSMMDGQVEAIKQRLAAAGLSTPVLAYSAKYASAFTVLFGMLSNLHPDSETAKVTRWISVPPDRGWKR
ncbi:MAG: porphobilinogen synthase [Bacteroides sp.]|nr:porphobilinogen synthase [Bacteroides sp.]